jgi:hypothetical protein
VDKHDVTNVDVSDMVMPNVMANIDELLLLYDDLAHNNEPVY